MTITLNTTWTQNDRQGNGETTTIALSGTPVEIQSAIDQLFSVEQATALRERLGLAAFSPASDA